MRTKAAVAFAGLLVVMGAGRAAAQDAETEYRRNCTADYQRFCSAYSPGSSEVEQCFTRFQPHLSKRCRDTIARFGGKR